MADIDAIWNSGVDCGCGAKLYVYIAYMKGLRIHYNYICKKCNMKGSWPALAKGKVGIRTNNRPSFKRS